MPDLGDHGIQYLSLRSYNRLTDLGLEEPTGFVGESSGNELSETVKGCSKNVCIKVRKP
jgi:hypothetical protein